MIRLFIAIRVPPEVRDALAAEQRRLAESGVSMRWVRPEGMHLTLVFLGNVAEDRRVATEAATEWAAQLVAPLRLAVSSLGCFPARGTPRVLWAGLAGEIEPLRALQRDLDARLRAAGFAVEDRRFTPHLTLGRAAPHGRRGTGDVVSKLPREPRDYGSWVAQDVEVIRSQLQPSGSVYTTLFTAPLGG